MVLGVTSRISRAVSEPRIPNVVDLLEHHGEGARSLGLDGCIACQPSCGEARRNPATTSSGRIEGHFQGGELRGDIEAGGDHR